MTIGELKAILAEKEALLGENAEVVLLNNTYDYVNVRNAYIQELRDSSDDFTGLVLEAGDEEFRAVHSIAVRL